MTNRVRINIVAAIVSATLTLGSKTATAMPDYSAFVIADGSDVGETVENVGDVNADGYDDIAVGNPAYNSNTGRVIIVSGADRSVIGALTGDNPQDRFGWRIAPLGDLTTPTPDGRHEFVVSAPNKTTNCPGGTLGGPAGDFQGYVRVFSFNGTSFSPLYTVSGVINGGFGSALASIGDDNGDGKRDFIVTAPHDNRASQCGTITNGRAYVLSGGNNGSVIRTHSSGNPAVSIWTDVANVGDIDGDGKIDYAAADVGNYTEIFKAGTGSTVTSLFWVAYSPGSTANEYGNSIAGLGDINNDGIGDIAVGRTSDTGNHTGVVKVFLGDDSGTEQTALDTLTGSSTLDDFGRSIVNMGDLDGDTISDFGVLAGKQGSVSAYIKVFSGATRARITALLNGCPIGGLAINGRANIRALGDLDGDSVQDYALGVLASGGLSFNYTLLSAANPGRKGSTCSYYRIGNIVAVL